MTSSKVQRDSGSTSICWNKPKSALKNTERLNSSVFNLSGNKSKMMCSNSALKVLATQKLQNKSPNYRGSTFCRLTTSINGNDDVQIIDQQKQSPIIDLVDDEQIQIERNQQKDSLIQQHSLFDRKLLQNKDEQSERPSHLSSFYQHQLSGASDTKYGGIRWDFNVNYGNHDNRFSFSSCLNNNNEHLPRKSRQDSSNQMQKTLSFLRAAMNKDNENASDQ